ncbi:MAG TPA: ATP synthase F1 subunit epsilon [Acidimicrobiales bacterium]|jgi:F-type H+-transporting ATPase subunit epsilon|nr:ATP synthase F1 subunit epsilon [Acidimicrobiales bacterium]
MAATFRVELVTPERVLYEGEAEEVSMRTDEGEIAFLARHEDFVGAVDISVVRIAGPGAAAGEGTEVRAAVHGGFVHVDAEKVQILAGVAELAGEIDVARARRALEAAEARAEVVEAGPEAVPGAERLVGAMLGLLAPDSAEAARRRARVRLEAAGAAPGS